MSVSTFGGLTSPVSVSTCSLVVSKATWNAVASCAHVQVGDLLGPFQGPLHLRSGHTHRAAP
nr:hypothetical protein [Streptomyces fulvoviolaceus]